MHPLLTSSPASRTAFHTAPGKSSHNAHLTLHKGSQWLLLAPSGSLSFVQVPQWPRALIFSDTAVSPAFLQKSRVLGRCAAGPRARPSWACESSSREPVTEGPPHNPLVHLPLPHSTSPSEPTSTADPSLCTMPRAHNTLGPMKRFYFVLMWEQNEYSNNDSKSNLNYIFVYISATIKYI